MKKFISAIMAVCLLLSCLAACGQKTTTSVIWEDDSGEVIGGDTSDGNTTEDGASGTTSGGKTTSGKTTSGKTKSGKASTSQGSGNKGNESSASSEYSFMKGKTYTMAITAEPQYQTTSFKAMISAFQKKYSCKIKTEQLVFNDYNKQVTQKMSSGKSYDICFIHGSMFPQGAISGIYADMTKAVTEVDSSNLVSEFTNRFKYGDKLYAVCSNKSVYPLVFFYNKLMFEENGLEDPVALYNKGQWTWDKVFEMGKEVTDKENGIYFLSQNLIGDANILGTPYVDIVDGKVVSYANTKEMYNALQLIHDIYIGNNAIGAPLVDTDGWTDFTKGLQFMFIQESAKYSEIAAKAVKSAAFGKSVSNLRVAPVPVDSRNASQAYPTGWLFGVAAGEGSDPRVAVTWANFAASFKSPTKGKTEMSDSDAALCNKLISGKVALVSQGWYATSSSTYNWTFVYDVCWKAGRGEDISKAIADAMPKLKACLEATVGNNYIIK